MEGWILLGKNRKCLRFGLGEGTFFFYLLYLRGAASGAKYP